VLLFFESTIAIPNGENLSGSGRVMVDMPIEVLLLGTSIHGSTCKISFEYDWVTHNMPVLSKYKRVGPLSSPAGYSKILFDLISILDILFPVISVNHILLPFGDKAIPIGPAFGVGILTSSIFPSLVSNFPIEFVLASVNHITLLSLSKIN
jgi:hypothetical protein